MGKKQAIIGAKNTNNISIKIAYHISLACFLVYCVDLERFQLVLVPSLSLYLCVLRFFLWSPDASDCIL